jgi:hypothetical protein
MEGMYGTSCRRPQGAATYDIAFSPEPVYVPQAQRILIFSERKI